MLRAILPSVVLLLSSVTSLHAGEGVLEINQACAVNTGCFSGDASGYPVTIDGSAGRSYRLTSDLVVPDQNTDGIRVASPSVSIDLGGFEIARAVCVGALTICRLSGTGSGVTRTASFPRGTSVKNGSVIGMGLYGVDLGEQSQVMDLRVRWSGSDGIRVDGGSVVSGSSAFENGVHGIYAPGLSSTVSSSHAGYNESHGIRTGESAIVSGNTAVFNLGSGISTEKGAVISNNTAHGNVLSGILALDGSMVSGNTAYNNSQAGINAGNGSVVKGNAVHKNGQLGLNGNSGSTISGNSVSDNGFAGISAGGASNLQGNTVFLNTGRGIVLSSSSAYRENVLNANGVEQVLGGVNLGSNSCNGATSCP
jgi:parallel beta-helix repeat protein